MAFTICPKCGKQIPEESKFCIFCGNKMTENKVEEPDRSAPQSTSGGTTVTSAIPVDDNDAVPQQAQPFQPDAVPLQGQPFQPEAVPLQAQPFPIGGANPAYAPNAPHSKKSHKKLWIILSSVLGGILLVTGLTLAFVFIIQPQMKYNGAKAALEEQRFDEAYQAFTELDDYKDSKNMVKETLYQKGIYLLEKKKYKESMAVFEELGDYSDSREQYQNAYYTYGVELLKNGSYQEASDVFYYLGDYSDSKEQYRLAYYHYGEQLIDEESFEDAIDVFESLGNYSESKKLLKQAKYGYAANHLDRSDLTTYEYLKELRAANYVDSKKLYDSLYAWKLTNIHFNTSQDDTLTKKSISKFAPVYCHFEFTGGPPDGSTYIFCKATWPDGSTLDKTRSNDKMSAGFTYWWGWKNGIYNNPEHGKKGTFSLVFYDENNNMIGKGSVKITE